MEYKVLLVDDEEAFHILIPNFLALSEEHKFTMYAAMNGKEGIEMYSKLASDRQKPDIVLMDLKMPVMDGVEATKRIIENDPKANIYLFTAYAETEIEKAALEAGAKGTINKIADWNRTLKDIITALEPLE
ncbi:MAG: response regulator transcription factor [Halobacteriota archaeon]